MRREKSERLRTPPPVRFADREDDFDDCPLCAVYGREPNAETIRVIEDAEAGRNLLGPFATVEESMSAMLDGD